MKNWLVNADRINLLFTDEKVQRKAADILRSAPVLKVAALGWLCFLVMTFTFLFTVRLALSLPLFR